MILSLDANVLIDLANGRRPLVRRRFDEAISAQDRIVTCSLAAHEALYGAAISTRPEAQLNIVRGVLSAVTVAEFTLEDAEAALFLRVSLRRMGRSIGPLDTFIAAQCLSRGWTMVTGNVREFARVLGLTVIDWTSETETL
jgi:tRNA(fMet)-specific endonuclease VapC